MYYEHMRQEKNTYECANPECVAKVHRYPSQMRGQTEVCCSRECRAVLQKVDLRGAANPNYKHGGYSEGSGLRPPKQHPVRKNPSHRLMSTCTCGNTKCLCAKQCARCAGRSFPVGEKPPPDESCRDRLPRKRGSGIQVTEKEVREALPNAHTFTELGKVLGINRHRAHYAVTKFNLDFSHFSRGRFRLVGIQNLCKNSECSNAGVKALLLREGLKENSCEVCGQAPEWCCSPLTIELHHVNGDRKDHRLENLRMLCPNCHSQTPTHRGRKSRGVKKRRRRE